MLVGIGNILTLFENITHRKRFICYHVGIFKKTKSGEKQDEEKGRQKWKKRVLTY